MLSEESLHQNEAHNAAEEHTTASEVHNASHEITKDDVFPHLLGELGDHPSFNIWGYKISDLPKIFIDDGVYIYSSPDAMEEAGVFTSDGHHIINKETGKPPSWDLSVTNLVVWEWVGMFICLVFFFIAGRKAKKNPEKAPKGVHNLIESVVMYLRNEVVMPNINSERAGNFLLPYFVALFMFILLSNLLGLTPGGHTATGAIGTTAALAITAYFVINITAMIEAGVGKWFHHLLGGAPWYLAPIMVPIEIISMFVKPFALTIRLFANMTAGHVVLLSLLGLIFFFKLSMGIGAGLAVAPIAVGFSLFMYVLELLVAFLQAYIFTILTAVFVGLAIGEHAHKEH